MWDNPASGSPVARSYLTHDGSNFGVIGVKDEAELHMLANVYLGGPESLVRPGCFRRTPARNRSASRLGRGAADRRPVDAAPRGRRPLDQADRLTSALQ